MDGNIVFLTMLPRSTLLDVSCALHARVKWPMCVACWSYPPADALSSYAYLRTNDARRLGSLFGLVCLGVLGALHGED
jgi:hypothetical protein